MKQFLALILCFCLFSCGNNTSSTSSTYGDAFALAEKAYADKPELATASKYIDQILEQIGKNPKDKAEVIALSEKAYEIAKTNKISSKQRGFLFSLIKEDYANEKTKGRILELANQMQAIKRPGTANILYKSLMDNFASSEEARLAQSKIDPSVTDLSLIHI